MRKSDVLELLWSEHSQRFHTLSSAVWLLYDLLTTFDQEVEFVWRSPNSIPKFLYLVSRYVGLFGQFTLASGILPVFCRGQLLTSLIFFPCLIMSIELSLMLRIDALYGRSRKVRVVLLTAFVLEVASAAWLNGLTYPTVFAELQPFPPKWPFKGCIFPVLDIYWYKFCWFPIIAFETLLFGLNTAKCTSYGRMDTPLIFRLFRDGTAYFAIAFVFMLVCIVSQFLDFPSASNALPTWLYAVFSYSGCHLLLSVRSVAAERERLDLTLLCAQASETQDGSADTPLALYTPDPPARVAPPPRISLSRRVGASFELLPRLSRVGRRSGGRDAAVGLESELEEQVDADGEQEVPPSPTLAGLCAESGSGSGSGSGHGYWADTERTAENV
ncbi:hypothetical protein C2E23DRAFT_848474 [Lenzites betulinus]|nr:hypothetical protein C2E23DRAFT_848474 [Lenzites betulinus]